MLDAVRRSETRPPEFRSPIFEEGYLIGTYLVVSPIREALNFKQNR